MGFETPDPGVALLRIDAGRWNFLSSLLAERLEEALREARDARARVVVLSTERPGPFLAHMDLEEALALHEGRPLAGDLAALARCGRELRVGPMVSIAVARGLAWAGGLELFCTANLRVAAESASFGLPESLLGLMAAGGGTSRVPRLIGEARALELVLDGRPIGARRALDWGLVNRVFPDARVEGEALAWARWIADRPASALEAAKKSVLRGLDQAAFRDAVALEQEIHAELSKRDREERLRRTREAVGRYAAGADPFEAWGLDPDQVD